MQTMLAMKNRHRTGSARARSRRGFSTIEALAASVITLMTVGSIYAVQQAQLKAFATQRTYADSQTITRSVIDLVTRELRMAGYYPTNSALFVHNELGCVGVPKIFWVATPTSVRFRADLNANGAIDVAGGEDVTYDISGTHIRRALGDNPATDLVDYASTSGGLTFEYFDNGNPPVQIAGVLAGCQLANIAKVRVTVKANIPNPANATLALKSTAESEVAIRSRANF